MSLGRVMPLLVLTGTIAVAASEGPQTIAKVQNAVRTLLQRSELQATARQLQADADQGSKIPRPDRPAELATYLRSTRTAETDRDVTRDYWQHPLVLERDDPQTLLLLSLGANGERDACVKTSETSAESDDICEPVTVATAPRR